ncbi:1-acyl-sn-glycerol-3-phosphate acyltransferase [Paucidesulfovibrio gracilis DSM 16080]|uniref:1-acyl-sn-glycerol-3-phosphate acyltransferase n=1 Tax=Paucidesulfovibrio gracilis DSM 16080 TaxID=1121449 RepID=A0A1T4WEA2_9BACT|nr:lysophospholipid acyltransferase family protein [Paucidesulfovibrio gracilis]SKA74981.1 1-acyl-sn-glycerol-3-phosphate acyltransferase [Paucidesulfovibrio gracilis DSM 16080]
MRKFLFYLLFFPITVYYSCAMGLMGFTKNRGRWGEKFGYAWTSKLAWLTGVRYEVDLSALEPGGHYVFMLNHQSQLDIMLGYWLLRDYHVRFLAKQSLWNVPVFGWAMWGAQHIPIDRSNRRAAMKSVENAVKVVKKGVSPIVFPEGTRAEDRSQLQSFKTGGIILALKTGLPVAPVVIHGMGEVLPKGAWKLNTKPVVRVKALPPIDTSAYTLKDRDKFRDDLYQKMNRAYLELRRESE